MTGQPPSSEQLSLVLGAIYDAAVETGAWRRALLSMEALLEANGSILVLKPDSRTSAGLTLIDHGPFEVATDLLARIPCDCPLAHIGPREVATIADLFTDSQWRASAFYRDVCAPEGVNDILCIDVRLDDRSTYRLRFSRTAELPRFAADEKAVAELLLPHLKRAFAISRTVQQDLTIHERYVEACERLGLGTMILDRRGELLHGNTVAGALLAEADGLAATGGRPHPVSLASKSEFDRNIRQLLASDSGATLVMSVPRGSARADLWLTLQKIPDHGAGYSGRRRPALAVFVRDPEFQFAQAEEAIRQLMHLTAAQAKLVLHLANGLSLVESAKRLGIRHSTARTHLRSIFDKTGHQRQSSLVRHVLNGVPGTANPLTHSAGKLAA